MATTPILTLCDKLVDVIQASWGPSGNDSVERVYEMPIEAKKLAGRKVYVFPNTYVSQGENRAEDGFTHDVIVLTVEAFKDQEKPPVEWTDERVDFVTEQVYDGLDFSRDTAFGGNGPLQWNGRTVYTVGAGPVQVCDFDRLDKLKIFWCEVPLTFFELR